MTKTVNTYVKRILAMFPCDKYQADALCRYIKKEHSRAEITCFILKKQIAVAGVIENYSFNKILIDEPFYGRITKNETREILYEICRREYDITFFPLNTFNANTFLLATCITPVVRAINVGYSGDEQITVDLVNRGLIGQSILPEYRFNGWPKWAHVLQTEIQQRLLQSKTKLTQIGAYSKGERPVGFNDYPDELERLVCYLTATTLCENCEVVEVGSGIGYGAYILASKACSVIGVEKDSVSVHYSSDNWGSISTNLRFEIGDAMSLELADESVDRVVCFEVLEHVENPQDMIKEMFRILRPGGMLIASTPNPCWFSYRVNTQGINSEPAEKLFEQQIWPWHLSGITPAKAVRMALGTGFFSADLLYPTYVKGFNNLSKICQAKSTELALTELNHATEWSIDDFALTNEFSPWFSNYSYVLVAGK